MIVCDENLSQRWINLLTGNGYEIFSIREHLAGISDTEVTQIAIDKNALILTEDKDFGDIVFAQDIKNVVLDYSFSADLPAIFQYSGGTTGVPKPAIGLHRNLVANTMQFKSWCDLQMAEETFLAAIPLYHVYGMVLAMVLGIRIAAQIVLIEDARNIEALLSAIMNYRVTFFPGVPNNYAAIIRNSEVREGKYNLRSVKACISGSAPLHSQIKSEFEKLTGGKLVEGYGLSEAPTATHCNPLFGEARPGSFGLPLPDVNCKIVAIDDENKIMDIGEAGECR